VVSIFFAIILIVLIFIIFRKQKIEFMKEESKKEIIFCLLWLLLYFILSIISSATNVNIINEAANWLFLVLFPLLIIAGSRKEKVIKTLKEIGIKRVEKKTIIRIFLVCILYEGMIIFVFSLSEEASNILNNIPKMLIRFPLFFCLMIFTAAFTEEFFFRGIIQRSMMNILKRPYTAILFAGILFGLYHFPFAFYLWDETAGSIINSLKMIMTDQAVFGCAFGLIYYKSNKNLWSSIILHAFANATIMALSVALSG